ncbi:MAG: hypothetical protein GY711_01550 [bacterium]|nr:hypothetical protein [bacterium]
MTSAQEVRRSVRRARCTAIAGYLVVALALASTSMAVGQGLWTASTDGRRGLVLLLAGLLVVLATAAFRASCSAWRRGAWLETLEREWTLQERRRELGIEPELPDEILAKIQREKYDLVHHRGWRVPSRRELRAIEAKWRPQHVGSPSR